MHTHRVEVLNRQMTTQLSAWSRITSISYSFHREVLFDGTSVVEKDPTAVNNRFDSP